MDTVTIFLAKALICFQGACHPVLLGHHTEPGTYPLAVLHTDQAGYGGDVLQYHRDHRGWFAIHRTFDSPSTRRRAKLYHTGRASDRRFVTNGCPNVEPEVYEQLKDCCRRMPLVIEE